MQQATAAFDDAEAVLRSAIGLKQFLPHRAVKRACLLRQPGETVGVQTPKRLEAT
jgi:hypothetical protein